MSICGMKIMKIKSEKILKYHQCKIVMYLKYKSILLIPSNKVLFPINNSFHTKVKFPLANKQYPCTHSHTNAKGEIRYSPKTMDLCHCCLY